MEFNFAFRLYGIDEESTGGYWICRIQLQNLIVWLNIGNTWWLWLSKKVVKQIEENLVVCDHY